MNFAQWALRKPVLPLVLIALLSVLGLRALGHMPLTYLPDIGQNRIYLQLQTAPAALDDIEHALARPIEQALAGVPEISFVSSRIGTQAVHYTLGLNDSRMSQQVLGRVKDRLNGLVPQLPLAFEIADIRAGSTRDMPMLELAILPRMGGLTDATTLVRRVVLPALHGIAGLSEVKQMAASCASLVHSTRRNPSARICSTRSDAHSTEVSMARGKLVDTDAPWGPASMTRFGNPSTCTPR